MPLHAYALLLLLVTDIGNKFKHGFNLQDQHCVTHFPTVPLTNKASFLQPSTPVTNIVNVHYFRQHALEIAVTPYENHLQKAISIYLYRSTSTYIYVDQCGQDSSITFVCVHPSHCHHSRTAFLY